jgi:hypothetical protein
MRIEHPDALSGLIELIKKLDASKHIYYGYWVWHMIGALPPTVVAPLEALLPTLREQTADQLLNCLTELKNKS